MSTPSPRRYEFDDAENATFARLAAAMIFVAGAMLVVSAIIGAAAVVLARSTFAGSVMLAPLGIAVAVIGAQQFAAARRFRKIVATRGNDISHLIAALDKMALEYRIQRWLWLTVLAVIVIALATTMVGR